MAIQGIPVPKTMIQAFMDSRNKRIENELREAQIKNYTGQATMRPYEMQLKQAQARQAIANATQAERLSAMFPQQGTGVNTGQPDQGSQAGQQGLPSDTGQTGSPLPASNNQSMPRVTLENAIAGHAALKIPFPTPVNGYYNTIFGKFKAGETQEEKRALDVKQKKEEEENAANVKKSNDLVDVGDFIIKQAGHATSLSDFYKKGYHSGPLNATRKWAKNAPEGAGIFSANATPLIAGPTKELSQRGGAIIAGMVMGSKPDYSQHDPYNKEILNDIHNKNYIAFQEAKKQWERMNPGKTYPKKLPKFYDKVRIVSPRGHEIIKPTEQLGEIINQFPGSTYRFEGD